MHASSIKYRYFFFYGQGVPDCDVFYYEIVKFVTSINK